LSVASIDRQYGMFDRAQVPGKTAAAKA